MINQILKTILGDKSKRDMKTLQPLVDAIKAVEPSIQALSNDDLRNKTVEFRSRIDENVKSITENIASLKEQIENEEDFEKKEVLYDQIDDLEKQSVEETEKLLNEIRPEAFAVVRETARRLSAEPIRVTANDHDRALAAKHDFVSIEGDEAVYANKWMAAGGEVEWNMVHYDVQLIGGTVLHQGKIAEMATGEGKTLVATLPVYLNALPGKGVHVVTVNDYLAKRDSEWMAPIFQFHGLTIDCIDKHRPSSAERREAYKCDIVYGTNNEFGFDYLRDNMVNTPEELVQRGHNYAIVDEVDSVLVDDARTPLIISGPTPKGDDQQFDELKPYVVKLFTAQKQIVQNELTRAKKLIGEGNTKEGGIALLRAYRGLPKNRALIKFLSEDGVKVLLQKTENTYLQEQGKRMHEIDQDLYFTIDEKHNQVELTEQGIELLSGDKDADFFVMPDIGSMMVDLEKEDLPTNEKAEKKDQIMRDFQVRSERVHTMNQLLKAYTLFEKDKEYVLMDGKVKIVDEQTGRIMDGRRYSNGLHQAIEAKESVKIEAATQTYATVTLQNYFRKYNKLSGMTGTAETEAGEFWEIYELEVVVIPTNRPIQRDDREDLVYKTAREKYNAVIDEVVKLREAGRPILVGTTNVEISELLSRALKMRKIPHQVLNAKLHAKEAEVVAEAGRPGTVTIATNMAGRGTDIKLTPESKAAGGLAIIGTERHDSRRVDRQLRGRAGRQGDPGSSQFFVSLEDNLMRLFGSERIAKMMDRMGHKEGEHIQHKMVSNSIERAQKRVEENNFGVRKRLLEFDDVMNSQREVIYKRRRHALYGERLQVDIANMAWDTVEGLVNAYKPAKDLEGLKMDVLRIFGMDIQMSEEEFNKGDEATHTRSLYELALKHYKEKNTRIAESAYPVVKNVYENQGEQFKNIVVPFTDGIKALQIPTNLENAYNTKGEGMIRDFEKSVTLAFIQDNWKVHLRNMDDLRTNVQSASYEQKDPLLIYKFESFELFKDMVDKQNREILSFLFKAHLPHPDPSQMRQAPTQPKQQEKLQTSGPGSGAENQVAGRGGVPQGAGAMPQQARPQKPQTVVKEGKSYSRNDRVTIQNMMSGEKKEVKYKQAEPLLSGNQWVIVED
ncbi:preprotein translocase subunit SecA [Phaeocystidibacter luteus]|uniref:Protein translocase subunit SecA n=1 Tax=Phaeocystidibacter luteus TaxID=911197 RepID=A0A6N6RKU4_9FLAO|nr:preprotein translocase subunit SecA [Phaeocystidibacter luteus]KAB2813909.1 preprotein translocase subunit SecA [Phaeocystidibacter luteus]